VRDTSDRREGTGVEGARAAFFVPQEDRSNAKVWRSIGGAMTAVITGLS
jgi:hypothetical protein